MFMYMMPRIGYVLETWTVLPFRKESGKGGDRGKVRGGRIMIMG